MIRSDEMMSKFKPEMQNLIWNVSKAVFVLLTTQIFDKQQISIFILLSLLFTFHALLPPLMNSNRNKNIIYARILKTAAIKK